MARSKDLDDNDNRKEGEAKHVSHFERAIEQAMGAGKAVGRDGDPAAEKWPNLWQWLTRIYVGRDLMKSPPSITIRLTPDGAMATLNDRDLCYAVDGAAGNLEDVFAALEASLTAPVPAIRMLGKGEPKLRKRKTGN